MKEQINPNSHYSVASRAALSTLFPCGIAKLCKGIIYLKFSAVEAQVSKLPTSSFNSAKNPNCSIFVSIYSITSLKSLPSQPFANSHLSAHTHTHRHCITLTPFFNGRGFGSCEPWSISNSESVHNVINTPDNSSMRPLPSVYKKLQGTVAKKTRKSVPVAFSSCGKCAWFPLEHF